MSTDTVGTGLHPHIAGRCPACRSDGTLFLGSGGYITCSVADCPDPGAAYDLLAAGPPTARDPFREALADAIQAQTGWDWEPEGQVPSGRDESEDLAEAVIQALGEWVPTDGVYSTGRGWLMIDGKRHRDLCRLEERPSSIRPPDPPPPPRGRRIA